MIRAMSSVVNGRGEVVPEDLSIWVNVVTSSSWNFGAVMFWDDMRTVDYLLSRPEMFAEPLRVTIEHDAPVALGDKLEIIAHVHPPGSSDVIGGRSFPPDSGSPRREGGSPTRAAGRR